MSGLWLSVGKAVGCLHNGAMELCLGKGVPIDALEGSCEVDAVRAVPAMDGAGGVSGADVGFLPSRA